MQKLNVSVVIIAKDEEKKIVRCLESIRWADDIVVIDGFSADRTAEVARSFGARVIQRKFSGSFADDRNAGLENAKNEWVLTLDADEVVTDEFREELIKALSKNDNTVLYKYHRKNYFLGHSMDHGGFHHYVPNVVKKSFVKFEGVVHEVPVYSGHAGIINADIEHHPFDSVGQFIERQNRYTGIAAKELFLKRGILSDKEIRKEMINKSFKIFWKSYFKKRGYKEGLYGLVFALLFAFINIMKWAKYWELCKDGGKS